VGDGGEDGRARLEGGRRRDRGNLGILEILVGNFIKTNWVGALIVLVP